MPFEVRIAGWRYCLQKVSMTQTIRDRTGMELAAAKAVTDAVLRGEPAAVLVSDWRAAVELSEALQHLGADARPARAGAGESNAGAPRRPA